MTSNLEGLKAHDRSENLYKRESWGEINPIFLWTSFMDGPPQLEYLSGFALNRPPLPVLHPPLRVYKTHVFAQAAAHLPSLPVIHALAWPHGRHSRAIFFPLLL